MPKKTFGKVIVKKKFWSLEKGIVMSITRGHARISFPGICLFALLLLFFVPISVPVFNIGIAQATFIWIPSSDISDNKLFGNPTVTDNIYLLSDVLLETPKFEVF